MLASSARAPAECRKCSAEDFADGRALQVFGAAREAAPRGEGAPCRFANGVGATRQVSPALTRSLSRALSLAPPPLARSLALSLSLVRSLSRSFAPPLSCSLSLSLALALSRSVARSLSRAHSLSCSLALALSRFLCVCAVLRCPHVFVCARACV